MIIEFIGTPGAGKTTLLPIVIDFFEEQAYKAYTVVAAARPFASRTVWGKVVLGLAPLSWQRPLLWRVFYYLSVIYRLKFIAQHPRMMGQLLTRQIRRPPAADVRQRKVLTWFFRQIGYYEFLQLQAKANEVLVFDEGFIHRVVQLYSSSIEKPAQAQLTAYVDLLPQPDLLIFVQASPATCEKRIYGRGLWQRAQHKTAAEITQFIHHAHQAVNLAVGQARHKNWTVIAINNDGDDLTAVRAHLRQQLAQIPLPGHQTAGVATAI